MAPFRRPFLQSADFSAGFGARSAVRFPQGPGIEQFRSRPSGLKISSDQSWIEFFDEAHSRAALKGTNLRGQTPICNFLRVPAVFDVSCENQRFSPKICVFQMICFRGEGENLQKSAKISVWARLVPFNRFVPLSAP